MKHKEKLLEIYEKSFDISDISNIPVSNSFESSWKKDQ